MSSIITFIQSSGLQFGTWMVMLAPSSNPLNTGVSGLWLVVTENGTFQVLFEAGESEGKITLSSEHD